MVASELNQRQHLAVAGAAVIGMTLASTLLAVVDPALAGHTAPHPTLTGSRGDALSILENNARVLAAPFLVCLLGFPASTASRTAGDLLVAAVAGASTIPVGVELGRWHGQLLPYIPQLPLEWAALTIAIGAWLTARTGHVPTRRLAPLAALTLALLTTAAAVETWATPHRHAAPQAARDQPHRSHEPVAAGGRVVACDPEYAPASASRFKVARSLPLTSFGSARPPGRRFPGLRQPPDPPRRDHMNYVALVARLTAAPELNDRNGTQVGRLRVAVQRPRGKDGEDRGADYVDVTVFGRQAQTCSQYLTKGRQVAVEGHLHHSEWQDQDGTRRQKLEVVARTVEFLGDRTRDENTTPSQETVQAAA